jgi:hypothetical protein
MFTAFTVTHFAPPPVTNTISLSILVLLWNMQKQQLGKVCVDGIKKEILMPI